MGVDRFTLRSSHRLTDHQLTLGVYLIYAGLNFRDTGVGGILFSGGRILSHKTCLLSLFSEMEFLETRIIRYPP